MPPSSSVVRVPSEPPPRVVVPNATLSGLLLPSAGIKLSKRAFDDSCVRVRPVEGEVLLKVHRTRFPSAICWEIAATEARGFACALRRVVNPAALQQIADARLRHAGA